LKSKSSSTRRREAYVRKNVDAAGSFCASSDGTDDGSLSRPFRDAAIPDEIVTIKNECCEVIP
jgi:hypothetical protein